jgi:hypothetical protein
MNSKSACCFLIKLMLEIFLPSTNTYFISYGPQTRNNKCSRSSRYVMFSVGRYQAILAYMDVILFKFAYLQFNGNVFGSAIVVPYGQTDTTDVRKRLIARKFLSSRK